MKRIVGLSILLALLTAVGAGAVNVSWEDTPLRTVLQQFFAEYPDVTYAVEANVPDIPVTASIHDQDLDSALRLLVQAAGVSFRKEGDAYTIFSRMQDALHRSRPVNLQIKEMPLAEAIELLLKDSELKYVIASGLTQLKVTAVLKDVPLATALQRIVSASGSSYTLDHDTVIVTPAEGLIITHQPSVQAPPEPRQDVLFPDHPDYRRHEGIRLKYVDAATVVPVFRMDPHVQIAQTGDKFVIIRGTAGAIERAKELIAMVDTPESLSRAIKLTATLTVEFKPLDGSPQRYTSVAENVGVEAVRQQLDSKGIHIGVTPWIIGSNASSTDSPNTDTGDYTITAVVVDGRITFKQFLGKLLRWFDTRVEGTTVSLVPDVETVILTDRREDPDSTLTTTLSLKACIEPSRVRNPYVRPSLSPIR